MRRIESADPCVRFISRNFLPGIRYAFVSSVQHALQASASTFSTLLPVSTPSLSLNEVKLSISISIIKPESDPVLRTDFSKSAAACFSERRPVSLSRSAASSTSMQPTSTHDLNCSPGITFHGFLPVHAYLIYPEDDTRIAW